MPESISSGSTTARRATGCARRSGRARAVHERADPATAPGGRVIVVRAAPERHPAGAGGAVPQQDASLAGGSGLSAGLLRAEQFLPRLQALVRAAAGRIPAA